MKMKKKITALPSIGEFSREAAESAAMIAALQRPLPLVLVVAGALGITAGALFLGVPAMLFGGGVLVSGLLGTGISYLRRDALVIAFLEQYNAALHNRAEEMAEYLHGEFKEMGIERGMKQIERLKRHREALKEVLGEKFDPSDVSYAQFLGTAEELFVQTLNCLKDAATQRHANDAIDIKDLRKSIKERPDQSIARRIELYEKGEARFEALLNSVEIAITGLSELIQEVASIGDDGAQAHKNFIARVKELSSRAGLYMDERRI